MLDGERVCALLTDAKGMPLYGLRLAAAWALATCTKHAMAQMNHDDD